MNLPLSDVAPLLCAGITTYSPMRHWCVGKGKKVGVVGLGGLGHMAVKFAHALGAHVVVFTTSPGKKDDALRLGADEVVVSCDADVMNKHNFVLDAVSADYDVAAYLRLLAIDGNLTLVGAPSKPLPVAAFDLIMGRRSLSGSAIGGMPLRKCSTSAALTTLRRTSKCSRFRSSAKRTRGCSSPM
jgi:uncharacterized zinc-type alcohol dehydrogenase-like protein